MTQSRHFDCRKRAGRRIGSVVPGGERAHFSTSWDHALGCEYSEVGSLNGGVLGFFVVPGFGRSRTVESR
jgi:hypothetical protein